MILRPLDLGRGLTKRLLATLIVLCTIAIGILTWTMVASLRQASRLQVDAVTFQTGMLNPLMADYITVLDEIGDGTDHSAEALAKQRLKLSTIRMRMEPHLNLLKQTADLLSNTSRNADIKKIIAETVSRTRADLDSVQADLSNPGHASQIGTIANALQDDLASSTGSILHAIDDDVNAQRERLNFLATMIGVLFSVLLASGLILLWLVSVLRQKASELKRLAITDPLTGLVNRGECMRQAARIGALADRDNVPIAIAIIDLDRFKAINDMHGHPAGDAVLRSVAQMIGASVREGDIVARLGGEEFAILLYNADRSAGCGVCEGIRHVIESAAIPFESTVITTTVSIGFALGYRGHATFETLYAQADKALYKAKQTGRNRVVAANDDPFVELRPASPVLAAAPFTAPLAV